MTRRYWVVFEHEWPEGTNPDETVFPTVRQYGALGKKLNAKELTIYSDEDALKEAWERERNQS